jgi:hypothetical protein
MLKCEMLDAIQREIDKHYGTQRTWTCLAGVDSQASCGTLQRRSKKSHQLNEVMREVV